MAGELYKGAHPQTFHSRSRHDQYLDHLEYKSYKIYLVSFMIIIGLIYVKGHSILGGLTLAVRIAVNIVRIGVLIQLVSGILFWTGNADSFQIVHIIIGILVVLSLWALGIVQGIQGGSFGLALATFVVGFLLALVGLFQKQWLVGSNHWIIQVIHLLLGLSAIGLAEMIGGRYRRMTANKATA